MIINNPTVKEHLLNLKLQLNEDLQNLEQIIEDDSSMKTPEGAFPKSRKFGFLALKGRQHTSPGQRPGYMMALVLALKGR